MNTSPSSNLHRAFTLVELLVIVGIVIILATLLVPGHARVKPAGRAFQCMANTKRLMLASLMYQTDNNDRLPMNFHGGYVPAINTPVRPWATGWLDWWTGTDNTNINFLVEPRYGSLGVYVGKSTNVYRCPADTYVSASQRARGWTARVRSVALNAYVGEGNAWATGYGYSAGGPNNLAVYKGAKTASDLLIPGPARTWVFADEHPDSINDPGLFAPNTASNFPDAPATYHNGAAGFAFADGHSEIYRWRGPKMNTPASRGGLLGVNFSTRNNYSTTTGDPDIFWLSYGSPRSTIQTVAD